MPCFRSFWEWIGFVPAFMFHDLEDRQEDMRLLNAELEEQLFQSRRNDTPKDPVTGQFTSAKLGTFNTGG